MKRQASSAAPKSPPRSRRPRHRPRTAAYSKIPSERETWLARAEKRSRDSGTGCVIVGMNGRIILFVSALFLSTVCRAPADADSNLQSTGRFALGGIGVAGTMSAGERAL